MTKKRFSAISFFSLKIVILGFGIVLSLMAFFITHFRASDSAMGLNNSFQSLGRGTGPLWTGVAFNLHPTLSF
jgi:hypothetical protein